MTGPTARLVAGAEEFAAEAEAWLAADPVRTSLVATALAGARGGQGVAGLRWLLVHEGTELVGAGMIGAPPTPVVHVPPMPDGAAAAVAGALAPAQHAPHAVVGDAASTLAFTRAWSALTGATAVRTMARGYHVLDRLVRPTGVPGGVRMATRADAELVESWTAAFHAEIWRDRARVALDRGQLHDRLAAGRLLLWEDGGAPVAMAGWHPPTGAPGRSVARVGTVYTVPGHRRRGYAGAVAAAATRGAAATGAAVVLLHTDLANPTSNGVYARLGYRLVGEGSAWTLAPAGRDTGISRSAGATTGGC